MPRVSNHEATECVPIRIIVLRFMRLPLPRRLALYSIASYGRPPPWFPISRVAQRTSRQRE